MTINIPIRPNIKDFGIEENKIQALNSLKLRIDKLKNILFNIILICTSILITLLIGLLISKKINLLPIFFQSTLGFIILLLIVFFASFMLQVIIFPIIFINSAFTEFIGRIVFGEEKIKMIENYSYNFLKYNDRLREYNEELENFWQNNPDSRKFGENLKEYIDYKENNRVENEKIKNEKLKQKQFWFDLSGFDFEKEVAKLYESMGYKVFLTNSVGDGGIDVVIYDKVGQKTIIQCKNHKAPIGPAVVRELYGVMISEDAAKAILVCSGGFTQGVHSFIKGKKIELMEINDIIALHSKCNP